jgi:hypothetical protein
VLSDFLGAVKKIVQILGTLFVPLHFRFVAEAEFLANFGCAFLVSEQDYLDLGVEQRPALDGVALDDVDVADKRLGCREDS